MEALADFEEKLSNLNIAASGSNQPDALRALLASATANPSHDDHPLIPPSPPDHSGSWQGPLAHSSETGINWNLLEATENTMLEISPLQEYIQSVSQASLDFISGNLSEDELLERISVGSDSDSSHGHPPQGESHLIFSSYPLFS